VSLVISVAIDVFHHSFLSSYNISEFSCKGASFSILGKLDSDFQNIESDTIFQNHINMNSQ